MPVKPCPRRACFAGFLALLCGPLLAGPVPADQITRRDAAFGYVTLDRALVEHPPAAGDGRDRVVREFDRITHFAFRGRFARSVGLMRDLSDQILPPELDAPADRAARSLRVDATPAVVVAGDTDAPQVVVRPLLGAVADAPPTLVLRLRRDGEASAEQSFEVDPAAGSTLHPTPPPAGHYLWEAVTPAGRVWPLGTWDSVPRRPSILRDELAARLDGFDTEDAELRRSAAALRGRLKLLADAPGDEWAASFLADRHQLEEDLPRETDELLAGRNPYRDRPGDYWRTLDHVGDGPPLSIPARVYAPPSAMRKIDAGQSVPLVIALHGAGGDENLFMDGYGAGLFKALADRYGFVAVTPLTYSAMADLRSPDLIVTAMRELYPVDAKRVYVVGHSLGAMLAGLWEGQRPELWAGAGLIAGGKPDAQLQPNGGGSPARVATFVAAAEFDGIFPPAAQRKSVEAAQAAGADVVLRVYPDEGHVSVVGAALGDAVGDLLGRGR